MDSFLFFNLRPKINVNDPMRPINIVIMIKILPSGDKVSEPLRENPTLLNADIVSKKISKKVHSVSVNNKQKVVNKIQPMLKEIIAITL